MVLTITKIFECHIVTVQLIIFTHFLHLLLYFFLFPNFVFFKYFSSYYLKSKEELQDGWLAGLVEERGQRVFLVHL